MLEDIRVHVKGQDSDDGDCPETLTNSLFLNSYSPNQAHLDVRALAILSPSHILLQFRKGSRRPAGNGIRKLYCLLGGLRRSEREREMESAAVTRCAGPISLSSLQSGTNCAFSEPF